MYQVHTGTYLWKFRNCKYKQVRTQLAQCCNGPYSGIVWNHLVLLCSSTYLLVMHVTIQEKSTFWFGTWYIWICTALKTVQIQMYWVPNQNVDFSWIVTCITTRYVLLSNLYRPVQVVSYDAWVHTIAALCHTKVCTEFVPWRRQSCKTATSLLCQSQGMPRA